jgi:hypothetical protein
MSDTTVSAIAAGASSAIALVAVFIALLAERRSRAVERRGAELQSAQVYLTLRTKFLEIFRDLGNLEQREPATPEEGRAREAYWHHAYDEWLVATKLAPHAVPELWNVFCEKTLTGVAHPALESSLEKLMNDPKAGFGAFAKEFVEAVGLNATTTESRIKR